MPTFEIPFVLHDSRKHFSYVKFEILVSYKKICSFDIKTSVKLKLQFSVHTLLKVCMQHNLRSVWTENCNSFSTQILHISEIDLWKCMIKQKRHHQIKAFKVLRWMTWRMKIEFNFWRQEYNKQSSKQTAVPQLDSSIICLKWLTKSMFKAFK